MQPEGWYLDPYGIHRGRWYSAGQPTGLVRDDGIESHDAPPSWQPKTTPVPVPAPPGDADDLKRADAFTRQDQSFDARSALRAVLNQWAAYGMRPRHRL
jgi:hypothetical protein